MTGSKLYLEKETQINISIPGMGMQEGGWDCRQGADRKGLQRQAKQSFKSWIEFQEVLVLISHIKYPRSVKLSIYYISNIKIHKHKCKYTEIH